jgi:hypothetical protein
MFYGACAGWDYGPIAGGCDIGSCMCRNGAENWGQHQVRHTDRTSPGLCKVLHIEKRAEGMGFGMWFSTKGLFLASELYRGG